MTSAAFGFGLFDANRFVDLAERWPAKIGDQRHCSFEWSGNGTAFLDEDQGRLNAT
mgnify:CR=1 FL=1